MPNADPATTFYHLKFERAGDFPLTETFYFADPDKSFFTLLPQIAIEVHPDPDREDGFAGHITIQTASLVRDLFLYADDPTLANSLEFADNFITLLPGTMRNVPFKLNAKISQDIQIHHLKLLTTHPFFQHHDNVG